MMQVSWLIQGLLTDLLPIEFLEIKTPFMWIRCTIQNPGSLQQALTEELLMPVVKEYLHSKGLLFTVLMIMDYADSSSFGFWL